MHAVFRKSVVSGKRRDLFCHFESTNDILLNTSRSSADHENMITGKYKATNVRHARAEAWHRSELWIIHVPTQARIRPRARHIDVALQSCFSTFAERSAHSSIKTLRPALTVESVCETQRCPYVNELSTAAPSGTAPHSPPAPPCARAPAPPCPPPPPQASSPRWRTPGRGA